MKHEAGKHPHVILIMADHLRRDSLTAYGAARAYAPRLDALANEGIVFERAYCAAPPCTPARFSMDTGKTPHTHGAIVNGHGFREGRVAGPEHRTLYELLDRGGYGITQMGVHHVQCEPRIEKRVPD